MNKKQQAEKAAREHEARVRMALRWSDEAPRPDVPPPTEGLTTGWMFNAYTYSVDVACSSFISHSIGRTDRTTTQRPLALYSTRKLALQALRAAMERGFAEELAKVDVLLASEE